MPAQDWKERLAALAKISKEQSENTETPRFSSASNPKQEHQNPASSPASVKKDSSASVSKNATANPPPL